GHFQPERTGSGSPEPYAERSARGRASQRPTRRRRRGGTPADRDDRDRRSWHLPHSRSPETGTVTVGRFGASLSTLRSPPKAPAPPGATSIGSSTNPNGGIATAGQDWGAAAEPHQKVLNSSEVDVTAATRSSEKPKFDKRS